MESFSLSKLAAVPFARFLLFLAGLDLQSDDRNLLLHFHRLGEFPPRVSAVHFKQRLVTDCSERPRSEKSPSEAEEGATAPWSSSQGSEPKQLFPILSVSLSEAAFRAETMISRKTIS